MTGSIDRPIIVIGAPRSGTTILRNTLALHQDLWHLPGESHAVLEGPCHPARSGYSSNRVVEVPEATAETLRADFFRRAINLSSTHADPKRVLAARTIAERSYAKLAVKLAERRLRGGRPVRIRFLEKTPKNALRVPLLAQLFPDAYFVYVTRRAEPNIASLAEGWHAVEGIGPFTRPRFANSAYPLAHSLDLADYHDRWWKFALPPGWEELRGTSVAEVAAWQYVQCNRIALDDLRAVDQPVRHIRHEDFVADAVAVTRDLFEWAQLEPSPAAERFAAALPRVNTIGKQAGTAARRDQIRALIDDAPEIRALESELGYSAGEQSTERRARSSTTENKLLYIAGYGRSGSTALATILSGHPSVVAVGEATFLADDWADPERPCSCGATYGECEFWSGLTFAPHELDGARHALRAVDRHVLRPWLRHPLRAQSSTAADYRRFTEKVNAYARLRSGCPIVLDSSKSARGAAARSVALHRLAGEDVHLVHLVRDGLASVDSMVTTGSNWAIEGHARVRRLRAPRAAVGWVRANLCALGARVVLGRGRSMQLSYDELLSNPAAALTRVGELVGVDLSTVATGVELHRPFPVGHVVGGNRIRMQGAVELWSEHPTPLRLGVGARLTFLVIGGWLQWLLRRTGATRQAPARRVLSSVDEGSAELDEIVRRFPQQDPLPARSFTVANTSGARMRRRPRPLADRIEGLA